MHTNKEQCFTGSDQPKLPPAHPPRPAFWFLVSPPSPTPNSQRVRVSVSIWSLDQSLVLGTFSWQVQWEELSTKVPTPAG